MNIQEYERVIVLNALKRHSGQSLCPDWGKWEQVALGQALESLIWELMTDAEKGGE